MLRTKNRGRTRCCDHHLRPMKVRECLLAAWIGKFDTNFEEGSPLATGEMEIQGGITQKPKHGVWVQLKELDDW